MAQGQNSDQQKQVSVTTDGGERKSGKVSIPVLILIVVLVAVIVGLVVAILMMKQQETPETPAVDTSGRGTLVTPENVHDIIAAETETNTDEAYTASMSIDWTFEDGTSVSKDAYVENHVSNSRTVYFDLVLADTMEMVYSSPYIPVGSTLKDFALDKDLDAGKYDAIVIYHLVDDNHVEVSNVSVTVTLYVKN